MAGIFKAYDIRGIYGKTLDEELALAIGRAFVTLLECRSVAIGRDMRPHSAPLFTALAEGITMQGADVIDLGICSTPMSYHGSGTLGADAGIMVTASHNPGEWNGFKLSRAQAVPISGVTGIAEIEKIVADGAFARPADVAGTIRAHDAVAAYVADIRQHAAFARPVRIAADLANAMGIYEVKVLQGIMDVDPLFDTLDGTFPNHEANPLNHATLAALQARVRAGNFDFGIAFDGDADRVGFVDETGAIVPMDMITALIAEDLLGRERGVILYDLRSSRAVKEVIEANGGDAMMSRVGHAFIKQQMREHNAIFAGELSGHYYFRANFFTESASLAAICVANIVSRTDRPLSELIKPMQRYFASGEINSTVRDAQAVLDRIRAKYGPRGRLYELDGISVEFDDWWFNVRMSNTEPLVRLNLEAKTAARMAETRDALLADIRG
jgi:phosphomannomutase